jgi:outer membrane protein
MKYQNTGAGMSDAERQATEKRLGQMQQNIATRKGTMEEQFAKDQVKFQEFMHKELDAFFEEYNKDKHYDYIFAYSRSSAQIMYVNKELDITNDVIEGMNARNTTAPKDATQKTK